MPLFKIFTDKEGVYRFFLKTDSKHISFISTGCSSKFQCLQKLELFKQQAFNNKCYIRLTTERGDPYFKFIKSVTNEVVGDSELFLNRRMMEKKITEIKKVVPVAKVDTLTYSG
ncbi:hypothetical protein ACFFU1_00200 [Algibacter miyuki]|uniref:DUF1508 domain-containing protein n=1 Tax=Algibacter miyuki TaxID=1306933 RepID=A0ABV5GUI4_9FLAO|nr:hypothetical protein [Algibacter miyuki]MDN3664629.1 hypothetical protein [Algibacter miyuki]